MVLPNDIVSISCHVLVCSKSNDKLNLTYNGHSLLATGNNTSVVWKDEAGNGFNDVECTAADGFTSICPSVRGKLLSDGLSVQLLSPHNRSIGRKIVYHICFKTPF